MEVPPEPEGFRKLCSRIGLAVMLGQKVQYALAGYFVLYLKAEKGLAADRIKEQFEQYLQVPMGRVISDIERDAKPANDLWQKIKYFQAERNWLVHDFDQEATPSLVRGDAFDHYIERMQAIASLAKEVMQGLSESAGRFDGGST